VLQFYGDDEAKKYASKYVQHGHNLNGAEFAHPRARAIAAAANQHLTALARFSVSSLFTSSRMIEIQSVMARRALELLSLNPGEPSHILDIGCGTQPQQEGGAAAEGSAANRCVHCAPLIRGHERHCATPLYAHIALTHLPSSLGSCVLALVIQVRV